MAWKYLYLWLALAMFVYGWKSGVFREIFVEGNLSMDKPRAWIHLGLSVAFMVCLNFFY